MSYKSLANLVKLDKKSYGQTCLLRELLLAAALNPPLPRRRRAAPCYSRSSSRQKMEQTDLLAELSKAWQSVPYLSLALIVSAWTIGVFGLSILLDDCGDGESAADAITKLARRREFMKSHVV